MQWVALMPLRGGSKSIPGKNIKEIGGKPLFAWALQAAVDSKVFDEVCVATDSVAIADKVSTLFSEQVRIVPRSPEVSTDEASTESVLLEFQATNKFDVLCLIQATSPMTEASDFVKAREQFETKRLDSMLTAVVSKRFHWTLNAKPSNYSPQNRPRRQDFPGHYEENGAFYFTRHETLLKSRNRLGGSIGIYEMSAEHQVELDEPIDWLVMEQQLRRRSHSERQCTPTSIQALVIDVDGTLTDGGMYYSASGEELKRFDTRDAHGLAQLRGKGIKVAVITAESSPAVHARMKKLGISDYHHGVKDKLPVLQSLCKKWGCTSHDVAYMGDDTGDLECLLNAGLSICPADAQTAIRDQAELVTRASAGHGAVREACDHLLAQKKQ